VRVLSRGRRAVGKSVTVLAVLAVMAASSPKDDVNSIQSRAACWPAVPALTHRRAVHTSMAGATCMLELLYRVTVVVPGVLHGWCTARWCTALCTTAHHHYTTTYTTHCTARYAAAWGAPKGALALYWTCVILYVGDRVVTVRMRVRKDEEWRARAGWST